MSSAPCASPGRRTPRGSRDQDRRLEVRPRWPTFTIKIDGVAHLDWRWNPPSLSSGRVFHDQRQRRALKGLPRRGLRTDQTAPYAIAYPSFEDLRTEIVLPKGGDGFAMVEGRRQDPGRDGDPPHGQTWTRASPVMEFDHPQPGPRIPGLRRQRGQPLLHRPQRRSSGDPWPQGREDAPTSSASGALIALSSWSASGP